MVTSRLLRFTLIDLMSHVRRTAKQYSFGWGAFFMIYFSLAMFQDDTNSQKSASPVYPALSCADCCSRDHKKHRQSPIMKTIYNSWISHCEVGFLENTYPADHACWQFLLANQGRLLLAPGGLEILRWFLVECSMDHVFPRARLLWLSG